MEGEGEAPWGCKLLREYVCMGVHVAHKGGLWEGLFILCFQAIWVSFPHWHLNLLHRHVITLIYYFIYYNIAIVSASIYSE